MDLNDAFYFVQVVEKGGFSAASRALNIPKSRLSRRVKQLEDDLGVRLLQRTSRVVTTTDIGEEFYRHAQDALARFEGAETAVRRKTNRIEGVVTVSCSVGMAQFALDQILPRFLLDNPGVTVVQRASNQMEDLVKGGIDVAIRGHRDTLPDSSLIQVRLAQVEWHLFCSPEYRDKSIRSDEPAVLAHHPALVLGRPREAHQWLLTDHKGQSAFGAVSGSVRQRRHDDAQARSGGVPLGSRPCLPMSAGPRWTPVRSCGCCRTGQQVVHRSACSCHLGRVFCPHSKPFWSSSSENFPRSSLEM